MANAGPVLLAPDEVRQAQAGSAEKPYGLRVPAPPLDVPDTGAAMRYWLAYTVKSLREAAGRKLSHVAASADRDQSTIYRFERGTMTFPSETDHIIAAYADDLDIEPYVIWQLAVDNWVASVGGKNGPPTVSEPSRRRERRRR